MKCQICDNENISFLQNFKPYVDMDWEFPIFECTHCKTRFALRKEGINYHEIIHMNQNQGSYSYHYYLAEKVKEYLDLNQIEKCEIFLKKASYKYAVVIDYINKITNKNKKILEIGCSTGFLTAFLRAKGFNVIGIDISKLAVKSAINFFGNYYSLKEPENYFFDFIFHTGLIGCVDNPKEFLNYYLEKLTLNGVMLFNAPNVESIRQTCELWVSTPPPDLNFLFSKQSFEFIINQNNYNYDITSLYDYEKKAGKMFHLTKRDSRFPIHFNKIQVDRNSKKSNNLKTLVKLILKKLIVLATKCRLLSPIYSEYGLIIKIEKKV